MSVILGFGANQYRLYEEGEVPSESNGKMIRGAMHPRIFLDLVCSSRHQLSEKDYSKIVARVNMLHHCRYRKQDGLEKVLECYRRLGAKPGWINQKRAGGGGGGE